jgi:predicted negative regulator of RcsB-dependent stress response
VQAYAHRLLARVQTRLGRYRDAHTDLRDALDYDATALIPLGDADHAAGHPTAARTAWQHALSILTDLDHPDADEVRAKLRRSGQPAPAADCAEPA